MHFFVRRVLFASLCSLTISHIVKIHILIGLSDLYENVSKFLKARLHRACNLDKIILPMDWFNNEF